MSGTLSGGGRHGRTVDPLRRTVRFGGRWPLPPSSGAPTRRCCTTATWLASWRPSTSPTSPRCWHRSIDEPEWFWDAVVRFLGLPFDGAVRAGARHVGRHRMGDVVRRRPVATRRRCASIACAADRPAVIWEGEDGATRTLTGAELRAAHRSHRVRTRGARRRRGRRGRTVHADGAGDRRRALRDRRSSVRSSCRSSPATAPTRSRSACATRDAVALVTAEGFTRRGKVVPMKETADAAVAQVPSVHTVVVVSSGRTDAPMHDRSRHPARRSARGIVHGARRRQRASVVRRVHERHDGPAQGRGARARGLHREGRGGGRVPDRPPAGRAPVLAHRHRLDHGPVGDRRHAGRGRHAVDVRRRARLSRARPALVVRRAAPRQRARRVADVDPIADGARRRSGARATISRRCASSRRPASRGTTDRGVGTSTSWAAAGARS